MKVATSEQMRKLDRCATDMFGIPSIVLMENAALAVVDVIADRYPSADRVALFCGTGQNGGDGFAIARHLLNRGVTPQIFVVGDAPAIKGDARTNLEICQRMNLPVWRVGDEGELDEALARTMNCDLIVDAVFGTGLSRAVTGTLADLFEALSLLRLPIVAVDVPSGIDASSHRVAGAAVHADITVSFALPKIAHIFSPAADYCGEVIVADVSIPGSVVAEENIQLAVATIDDVLPFFAPRFADTHKGIYGHVAIHAGSEGRSGAAVLAARGAVRSGAGLVSVLTDRDTARVVDAASIESMTIAVDDDAAFHTALEGKEVLLIGPGLPDDGAAYERTRRILRDLRIAVVLDAQAVNAYAGRLDELTSLTCPRIMTPHPGELARLIGTTAAEINDDRVAAARQAAQLTQSIIVLKGHQTLIATPEGEVMINPTGNPGMASGGMGDVLGGIVATLVARGVALFDAAIAGVYLHGFAGDRLLAQQGDTGLTALDLAESLPSAITALRGAS